MNSFMQWTLGICLNDAEISLSREFYLSSGRVMGLTNDLYSWNVEKSRSQGRHWNAVRVIMSQYTLKEVDALIYLKGLVVAHEQETRRLGAEALRKCESSPTMASYVNAMG